MPHTSQADSKIRASADPVESHGSQESLRPQRDTVFDTIHRLKKVWEVKEPTGQNVIEEAAASLQSVVDTPDETTPDVVLDLAGAYLGRCLHDLSLFANRGALTETVQESAVSHLENAANDLSAFLSQLQEYGYGSVFENMVDMHANFVLGHLASNEMDIVACNYAISRLETQRVIDKDRPDLIAKIDAELAVEKQNMQHNLEWQKVNRKLAEATKALISTNPSINLEQEANDAHYFAYIYGEELRGSRKQKARGYGNPALRTSVVIGEETQPATALAAVA